VADALRRKDQELLRKYDELALARYNSILKVESKSSLYKISDLVEIGKNKIRSGPFGSDLLHSEFVDSGVTVLGIDNVVNNRFEISKSRFITHGKFEKLKRYQVFPDDVLITIMGTVGRSAVVPEIIGEAINTKHLVAITLNTKLANPSFISYSFTHNNSILYQIRRKSKGAIMDGLNIGIIKDLDIELPPLEVQNDFADFLKTIEELKLNVIGGKSGDLFHSLIQRTFSGE
jgi:type I restriction enzyme S subunit